MSTRVSAVPDIVWPRCQSAVPLDPRIEAAVADLLSSMTLEEKVGQMMQADIRYATPDDVKRFHLGAVLNGGGAYPNNNRAASPADWLAHADAYYEASMNSAEGAVAIPILWGTDAVHGHNNVSGATLFPHNIGLGAARNPDLVEWIGAATAREVAATGIDWTFAPTLAVVRDDRWGRTYESYSEDPEIVRSYAPSMTCGLQGAPGTEAFLDSAHILATAKHFIGDGGTEAGIDQGDNRCTEEELRDLHGQGYFTALQAGVQTVMVSFNSWRGSQLHGHRYLLSDVLKEQMGFDGILVTDWNGFRYVDDVEFLSCKSAINAGVDMIMVPEDFRDLIANTIAQVRAGEISGDRIDDAVTRILRVKMRAGLFAKGKPSSRPSAADLRVIGCTAHRNLARQAVRESLVLLKNEGQILPLRRASKVLVVGDGANDIGRQSGGWSVTWQGGDTVNADFPNATSIFAGIKAAAESGGGSARLSVDGDIQELPDVAIVVFGEEPYAEGQGDRKALSYSATRPSDLALLRKLKSRGVPVVSVFLTGRPLWINPELNASDAFVVAWLPGSEGAGVADLLFRDANGAIQYDFTGRLSFSWPADALQTSVNRHDTAYAPLFRYGYGLCAGDKVSIGALSEDDSAADIEDVGAGLLRIFDGRPVAPFGAFVGDGTQAQTPVIGSFSASASEAIRVTAADRRVQEDARRVVWSGNNQARVFFRADQPLDISELAAGGAAVVFELKLETHPTARVTFEFGDAEHDVAALDITALLQQTPLGSWRTISIDLQEFVGTWHSEKVSTPFLISTAGALEFSFADIRVLATDQSSSERELEGGRDD